MLGSIISFLIGAGVFLALITTVQLGGRLIWAGLTYPNGYVRVSVRMVFALVVIVMLISAD